MARYRGPAHRRASRRAQARDRNTVTNLIEDLRAYDQQPARPATDS
jgi:hypothetical protein